MRALLLGFGNVGRTLAEILANRSRYPALGELDVALVGIVTGTRGALADERGLDPGAALEGFRRDGGFVPGRPGFSGLDAPAAVSTLDYDVLIELTPLSVRDRGAAAVAHCRGALDRGRHVVTGNKGPVAWAYGALSALARSRGAAFLHEAAVMDGVPVFSLARHGLRGNLVRRIDGVLNATSNFVLGAMERGTPLGEAVAEAQRLGVAEADPSLDLDGWDAAVKIAALANVLMGAELEPERVEREGIGGITPEALAAVAARGRRLKPVAEAQRRGDAVVAGVRLAEVPAGHPFAAVEGTGSIVRFETDLLGTVLIAEQDPDLHTTAFGVVADLLAIARGEY
ncbi:MAG: homoserine dehydrogenase [Acidobacteriota bacterium]